MLKDNAQKNQFNNQNIFLFSTKDSYDMREVKKAYKLKLCDKTVSCITSSAPNPYKCNGFSECSRVKEILKLFI